MGLDTRGDLTHKLRNMPNCVEPQKLDLYAYPRRSGVFLNLFGFHSVYVIGQEGADLCKIGIAREPAQRFSNLVGSNPVPIGVYYLLWTPSKFIARTIESAAHELLKRAGKHHRNEWFAVSRKWAIEAVKTAAHSSYPKIRFLDHSMMVEHLGNKNLELGDKTKDGKLIPRFTINFSDAERDLIAAALIDDPESPIVPELSLDDCVMLLNPNLRWGDMDRNGSLGNRFKRDREFALKPSKDAVITRA